MLGWAPGAQGCPSLLSFSLLFQRAWQWELDLEPSGNPPLPPSKVPGKAQPCFLGVSLPLELPAPPHPVPEGGWRSVGW